MKIDYRVQREKKFRQKLTKRFYSYLHSKDDDNVIAHKIALDVELLLLGIHDSHKNIECMAQEGKSHEEILEEIRDFKENRWFA